jgi:adenylate cyclase
MLSPKTKRNIARLLPFGLIWLISGWVFLVVEYAATDGSGGLPSTAIQVNWKIFIFSSFALMAVGLFVGAIELAWLNQAFAKQSFARKILYKLLIYILILFIIILLTFPIAASFELETGVLDSRVWEKFFRYFISISNLSTVVQMAVSVGASLFYAEISDNIGHGVLINFFTGKYHSPIEEERIFMFADMRSSTTIAEKLGHISYFKLLKEYYADLSGAIIQYGGEIYQYVGDEIVVSWPYESGIRNHNCIRCFFAMQEDLRKREDWYRKKFGLVPTFKAGLHSGKVTTGEIGVIKKEILFTGDVLNTTARIQGLCNSYDVDLLISDDLIQGLMPDPEFQFRSMGESELRGKQAEMGLFTVV